MGGAGLSLNAVAGGNIGIIGVIGNIVSGRLDAPPDAIHVGFVAFLEDEIIARAVLPVGGMIAHIIWSYRGAAPISRVQRVLLPY
ncbi:hypothetical protein ES703_20952 [subsurface metagenome]